jgi:glycosidase
VLLTSPGVPFVYYGEEIGMTGTKPDEDIRRPMQWTSDSFTVGFTTAVPWHTVAADYQERSVALQTDDPHSLLNHYRQLIHLRQEQEALRTGNWTLVDARPGRVYAFLRYSEAQTVLVIINMSDKATDDYSLSLESGPLTAGVSASLLFGEGTVTAPVVTSDGGFTDYVPLAELPPHSTFVIDLTP